MYVGISRFRIRQRMIVKCGTVLYKLVLVKLYEAQKSNQEY